MSFCLIAPEWMCFEQLQNMRPACAASMTHRQLRPFTLTDRQASNFSGTNRNDHRHRVIQSVLCNGCGDSVIDGIVEVIGWGDFEVF